MNTLDEQLAELADHLDAELAARTGTAARHEPVRHRTLAVAAAFVVVAGLAGVAYVSRDQSAITPAEPSAPNTDRAVSTTAPTTELERDAFQAWTALWSLAPYGDETNREREAIIEHYRTECMQQNGLNYQPYPYVSSDRSPATSMLAPLPTIDDVRRHGYSAYPLVFGDAGNPVESATWAQAEAANNAAAAQSPQWEATLRGPSPNGTSCNSQADTALAAHVNLTALNMWSDAAAHLLPTWTAVGLTQEPLATARTAWTSCMAARGFDYNDPTEPQLEYQSSPDADADEFNTALADTECRQSAGYRDALLQTVTTTYNDWLTANATFVEQLRTATLTEAAAVHDLATQLGLT